MQNWDNAVDVFKYSYYFWNHITVIRKAAEKCEGDIDKKKKIDIEKKFFIRIFIS